MDPLTRKKISRTALRKHCKKLEGDVDALLAAFPADGIVKLKVLKTNYEAQIEKVNAASDDIAALIETSEDLETDVEETLVLNDVFYSTLVKINEKLSDSTKDTKPDTKDTKLTSKASTTSSSIDTSVANTKLPKIELPPFEGDILHWQTFWDKFESNVHNKTNLSDVDKFSYLSSLLKGPAGQCISGLKLTSENYKEAVELLKARFGNTQLLINRYAESFDDLKPVKSMNQVTDLRSMYDHVETTVRNLKSLKIDATTYGAFLVPLLSRKLPQELKKIMSRQFKEKIWDFTELMRIYKEELETQERISIESTSSHNEEDFSTANLHTQSRGSKQHNHKSGSNDHPRKGAGCVYCGGNHIPGKCPNVTDIQSRVNILRKKGTCFICFQKGHIAPKCKTPYQCKKCGGRHHVSICDAESTDRVDTPTHGNSRQLTPSAPQFTPSTTQNFAQVPWGVPPDVQNFRHYAPQFVPQYAPQFPVYPQGTNQFVAMPSYPFNPGVMTAPPRVQMRPPDPSANLPVPTTSCSSTSSEKSVLLLTGRGTVRNTSRGNLSATVRFLFDDGSMRSYMTEWLRNKLELPVCGTDICDVSGFGGHTTGAKQVDLVKLSVVSNFGEPMIIEVVVVPVVCGPLPRQRPKAAKLNYPHLQNLVLSDYTDDPRMEVDVLIGGDYYWDFITGKVIRGPERQTPVALETTIGWVLSGPNKYHPSEDTHCSVTVNLNCTVESRLDELKQFWEVEDSPIPVDEVMQQFKSDVEFNGERYIVKLPFKPDHEFLPDNRRLSERRLDTLCKRFEKQVEVCKSYDKVFREYEVDGIIEEVQQDDVGEPGRVHYLPHRPIIKEERETTKVRPVFDASAKTVGPSLNECLHTGPNLLSVIYDVLIRLQLHKIVVMSDIKQAFLNVEVHPDHVDYLRFLWRENGCGDVIKTYRFLVVLFGLTPSPFLLLATIRHHCERMVEEGQIDQAFVDKFLKTLYMDDSINGADTVDGAFDTYKRSKKLMESAGFLLRKWCSNSKTLMEMIRNAEADSNSNEENVKSENVKSENVKSENVKPVLGVMLDIDTDEIVFDLSNIIEMAQTKEATKSNVLSIVASFFDPVGYLAPITSQGKVIFQLSCKSKIKWDEMNPDEILVLWKKFIKLITAIKTIRVKRCVIPELVDNIVNVEVHGFSDSSGAAYCAVVYLRKLTSCGVVEVRFLTAKTKVAPLKKVTTPRLELLSCVLLSNLVAAVLSPLADWGYDQYVTCWNDNSSAIGWITYENRDRGPWVQPRVNKIRKKVPAEKWRHVPGEVNPADIATRDISPDTVNPDSVWFTGPKFLYGNPETWPTSTVSEGDVLPDERITRSTVVNVVLSDANFDEVLDVTKFSSLHRLYMVVAFVLRFKHNLLARVRKSQTRQGDISITEYREAEKMIIRNEQLHIQKKEKFSLLKKSLNLFSDADGIVRVRGRLENSELGYNAKFPILLRDSHFLKLQVRKSHNEIWHDRLKPTLAKLRSKFWVTRGRQVVKRVIAPCVTCKRHLAKGLLPPPSPPLPEFRVRTDHCFQTTGVDYAGPLLVKSIYGSSTIMNKAYICLFTCATSRAVHLELVPNLEADAFLRSLRRFFNRRGKPNLLIDDNANNFTAKSVKTFLLQNGVEHSPILTASPWWGGFYERLVRSVKTPLKKVVGTAKLNYEEMETVLVEIEGIINTRPLTYLYDDDVSEPLTPSHLLTGRNLADAPTEDAPSTASDAETVTNRFRYLQTTLQSAWKKFQHHYLTELREHHMYTRRRTNDGNVLKVGDVVIVKDDDVRSRNLWRLGRVESLVVGKDDQVRGANLSTISKKFRHTKMSRPLQKIIPLEVSSDPTDVTNPLRNESLPEVVDHDESTMSRRACAVVGESRRRAENQM